MFTNKIVSFKIFVNILVEKPNGSSMYKPTLKYFIFLGIVVRNRLILFSCIIYNLIKSRLCLELCKTDLL